jgi:hypothetical protein
MASKKHTHKYERIDGVWCCALPDCSHFMPSNVRGGDVSGKRSVCWECKNEFILTIPLMKKAQPLCLICAQIEADNAIVEDGDDFASIADRISNVTPTLKDKLSN